jgi:transposase
MANRRIEMHEYQDALYRMRLGHTDRAISRDRVLGRRKLGELRAVAVDRGWLDPQSALPTPAQIAAVLAGRDGDTDAVAPLAKRSSVEPFAERIRQWFEQGVQGAAIHAALVRDHGFVGHYSSVRRYLNKLKESQPPSATMILDFAPGEAAQVDFGAGPVVFDPETGTEVRTWFFVMTLCFSRHQYVEFVLDQSAETWQRCHHHALRHFGGVPAKVIIDNPKCAITRAVIDDPEVQRAYAECAQGYGFVISPCPPADAAKKGIVESGVKYVKRNFLPLRTFRDLQDLNRQALDWVMSVAGQRTHGTTRQQPLALFELERSSLRPLPARTPEVCSWARLKVHRDTHVQFDYCLYSVPYKLIGTHTTLRATSHQVAIFNAAHEMVAVHPRGRRRGARSTNDDHLPPAALAWKMQSSVYCLEQAEQIGPACLALVYRMFGDRVLDRLRGVQALLRLVDRFGKERLELACARMGEVDRVSTRTVRVMLEKGLERPPESAPPPSPVYQGQARYYRGKSSASGPTLH